MKNLTLLVELIGRISHPTTHFIYVTMWAFSDSGMCIRSWFSSMLKVGQSTD